MGYNYLMAEKIQFPLVVRQNFLLILFKMFQAVAALVGILLILTLGLSLVSTGAATSLGIIGLVVVLVLSLGIVATALLWWRNDYYEIYRDRIVHYQGVFWKRMRDLRFPTLDEIKLTQSFWGTKLNFGSINITSTETGEEISLKNIPNPKYYEKIIRYTMPDAERV